MIDFTTIAGILGAAGLLAATFMTGEISSVFLNFHGFLIVCGGTLVALLINTPFEYLLASVLALKNLFTGTRSHPRSIIPELVNAARGVHSRGLGQLQVIDPAAGGGFPRRAAQVALEFKNADYVQEILEREITQWMDRKNEIVNVYRTMGVVAPMFGLLGTLIGIIEVLRHISDPEQVGASMSVAVTTAFYGILLANLIAVPIAGKLRIRFWEEYIMRRIAAEGIVLMLKGVVPAVLERRLESYVAE